MNPKLVATLGGETFDVEFTDDGDIDILGHNLEFDQTIAALGGEKSNALLLFDWWYLNPGHVIVWGLFNIQKEALVQLANDWAIHVKQAAAKIPKTPTERIPWPPEVSANIAIYSADNAAHSDTHDSLCAAVYNTAHNSLTSAADYVDPERIDIEKRYLAREKEKAWQRRQFVKIMKDFGVGTSGT